MMPLVFLLSTKSPESLNSAVTMLVRVLTQTITSAETIYLADSSPAPLRAALRLVTAGHRQEISC